MVTTIRQISDNNTRRDILYHSIKKARMGGLVAKCAPLLLWQSG